MPSSTRIEYREGEEFVHVARGHPIVNIARFIPNLFIVIWAFSAGQSLPNPVPVELAAVCLAVALLAANSHSRVLEQIQLTLTTERVLYRPSLTPQCWFEHDIREIGSIQVNQGLLGEWFGYVQVEVRLKDGKISKASYIRNAREFITQFYAQKRANSGVSASRLFG